MSRLENISQKRLTSYFTFLDRLRESGVTNMYGASPYLEDAFRIKRETSTPVVVAWMKTFSRDKTPAERAALANPQHNASDTADDANPAARGASAAVGGGET